MADLLQSGKDWLSAQRSAFWHSRLEDSLPLLSESTLAGELPTGSNRVLAQIIEDALAGQLVSGPVTYDVRVSDGAVASDSLTRF